MPKPPRRRLTQSEQFDRDQLYYEGRRTARLWSWAICIGILVIATAVNELLRLLHRWPH